MKKRKGFTMIELVVVIVILSILVLILIPNVMGAINKAENLSYDMTIKRLNEAAIMFTIDYPNTAVRWNMHDGGTPAFELIDYPYKAWSLYLDEWPVNPKNKNGTFAVDISEDGEISIYERNHPGGD